MRIRSRPLCHLALVLSALLVNFSSQAHHSSAMFDKQTVREVRATVREFQWTNPHVWIQVMIANDQGDQQEWSIEAGGRNTLFRRGWRPTSFQPGDVIQIKFNPMRDGSSAGGFVAAKLADGETLGSW